jgi:hypothetical protein
VRCFIGSKRGKSLSGRKANGCHRLIFLLAIVACLGLLDWLHYGRTTDKEIVCKVLGASILNITNLLSKDFLKLVGISLFSIPNILLVVGQLAAGICVSHRHRLQTVCDYWCDRTDYRTLNRHPE